MGIYLGDWWQYYGDLDDDDGEDDDEDGSSDDDDEEQPSLRGTVPLLRIWALISLQCAPFK